MHEQMSRSGGESEANSPMFKSPSKLNTHLSTHCNRDERLGRPCPAREQNQTCGVEARYAKRREYFLQNKE
ncbi:hypothetical protein TNCV_2166531 [Trichonephila clavipes]|nr:hypothetical protein TNCV_2166531 [Trichonephila clavipes]